ncbi:MAG: alanine-tRNA synthetase second additional domain-containing protein [Porphyromonas sp.]|nr:alanine-tRNA synthetase second additional domain-containing protein [Porphyromonas sp.]
MKPKHVLEDLTQATPKRVQEYWVLAQYYAPRGKERLMTLGEQLTHQHLSFTDRLIGIIGDSGSGKSSLIRGMFSGLELSNDDDIIDPSKIMQVRSFLDNEREYSTYHIDMRFQTAFTQMYEIVDFVQDRLRKGKRLVIEHFNLLAPALGRNADLLVGIGEEIIITRPTIFGPQPQSIYNIVHSSLRYRKMAHSAEEITMLSLEELFGIEMSEYYSADIRNGFVLKFNKKPEIDFPALSKRVHDYIAQDLPINYSDETHITLGDYKLPCSGPRLHMASTGEIEDLHIYRDLPYDQRYQAWCLIGLVGEQSQLTSELIMDRNTQYFL